MQKADSDTERKEDPPFHIFIIHFQFLYYAPFLSLSLSIYLSHFISNNILSLSRLAYNSTCRTNSTADTFNMRWYDYIYEQIVPRIRLM